MALVNNLCSSEKTKLFIFSNSYPFNIGEEFLAIELEFLAAFFDITLIPVGVSKIEQNRDPKLKVNNYVIANLSFIRMLIQVLVSIFSLSFYIIFVREKSIIQKMGLREILRFVSHYAKAKIIAKLIKELVKKNIDKKLVFYSYWLDFSVFSLNFIKDRQNFKFVARAHGIDLFADQNINGYIPLQLQKIQLLDKLFLVSESGMSYLLKKYGPQISNKLAISKLGIRKLYASALSENFSYKKHKIISVSGCVAIKRIHLIIDLIAKLRTIGLPIEWHHIGGGELLNKLVNYAQVHLQSDFLFYGYQTNGQVQEILANNNYTAFISCTFSEGGNPVSMQEAQAYALPIIATNVGGVPEVLADYDCGWLLERDFDLENVAKRLSHDLNNAEIMKRKSQDAYKSYLAKYQAEKNYTQFCKALLEL